MPESLSLRIDGLDELIKKMQSVEDGKYVKKALTAGGERVKDQAGKYPRAGKANSDSERRWYERNYGPKWRNADGSVKGRNTSEMLGKKWYVKPDQYSVAVGNPVSYAQYVHGDNKQAKNMGDKGWRKLGETAKRLSDDIVKDVQAAFRQMWEKAH